VEEAIAALSGGADLIDVKEPRKGPLGRAEIEIVRAIVGTVGSKAPVSAALGELGDISLPVYKSYAGLGLRFVKLGLSRCGDRQWRRGLLDIRDNLGGETLLVPSAYADYDSVAAPSIEEVESFAREHHFSHFLIDTYHKDGRSLLDHPEACSFLNRLRQLQDQGGIEVALAGSLQLRQIAEVMQYRPAWIAVRGAACRNGNRNEPICEERVLAITRMLNAAHES
jgi:uncharacterized protein (UPF0264 family)